MPRKASKKTAQVERKKPVAKTTKSVRKATIILPDSVVKMLNSVHRLEKDLAAIENLNTQEGLSEQEKMLIAELHSMNMNLPAIGADIYKMVNARRQYLSHRAMEASIAYAKGA